jgi:hypothetical protein
MIDNIRKHFWQADRSILNGKFTSIVNPFQTWLCQPVKYAHGSLLVSTTNSLFYVNDFLFGQFQTRLKELYLQRFPCSCIWIRVGQSSICRLTMSYLALPFIIFFTWLFISIRSSSSTHNPLNGQHLQAIWVVYIRYITNLLQSRLNCYNYLDRRHFGVEIPKD